MAYESARLKSIGGQNNEFFGGDVFSYSPSSDSLTTITAASYFDSAFESLEAGDIIFVNHDEGIAQLKVTAKAEDSVTVASGVGGLVAIQSISGPGAVDILSETTEMTTTGADAYTIADGGYIGQKKTVIMIVDGGAGVLTPANGLGYTTITFADAGDSVQLDWRSGGWALVGQGGLGTGPVSA